VLNLDLGTPIEIDGRTCIRTHVGSSGHAVFGPYIDLSSGHFVVEYNLAAADGQNLDRSDICAVLDVASENGQLIFAREEIVASRLASGPLCIAIQFKVTRPGTFEFRVAVTGTAALVIDDYCRILLLPHADADAQALLDETRFPVPKAMTNPVFFLENRSLLYRFYENGATVKIVDDLVIVTIEGISFNAGSIDDIRFVEEIFFRRTYNFLSGRDCCVIDIGMNLGLVAMTFASKPYVREVHSFEPFRSTYARAMANFALNPELFAKIRPNNFGLADNDKDVTILIGDDRDSGAMSIRGSGVGSPESIVVCDAASVLGPIIARAQENGFDIIAKVDCEGSEFPIFKVLEENNLLTKITAFMVEWHRGNEGKTQHDLIDPLKGHGFLAFDLTRKTGNGFFYAVKQTPPAA